MAISDRIQSIEQHIKESYQELEGIGIDTTEVDKNLENIPKLIDGYWETLPKVTGEGTSITLDNTKEGKMKINLKGNTSQETTTGANLVNFFNPTGTYNITYDSTTQIYTTNAITGGYGGFHIYNSNNPIEIPVGTSKYYYSADIRLKSGTYSNSLNYFRAGGTIANVERTSVEIANPNMTSSFQRYIFEVTYVNSGDTATSSADHIAQLKTGADNCVLEVKNVMISSANVSYEPYTNGASPNPDYPQDIHVVSGDNSINVCGKNLFNGIWIEGTVNLNTGKFTSASRNRSDFIQVIPNTQYTIWTGGGITTYFIEYDKNHNFIITNTIRAVETQKTFTTNENTKYAVLYQYTAYSPTNKVQLELGSTATTYESYKGASYPINLGDIELCKIGNYQDSIKKSTGKNLYSGETELGTISQSDGITISSSGTVSYTPSYTEILPSTQYTFSFGGTNLAVRLFYYNSNKEYISTDVYSVSGNNFTFTTLSNAKYIRYQFNKAYDINLQLEKGSSSSEYEPYGTRWYLNKQIGKVILDGTESGWSYPSANRFNLDGFANNYLKSQDNITYMSNNYIAYKQTGDNSTFNIFIYFY